MEIIVRGNVVVLDDDFKMPAGSLKLDGEGYACVSTYIGSRQGVSRYKYTLLHRIIMGAVPGQMVDHVNFNKLDNRRSNLRFCTYAQNNHHRRTRGYARLKNGSFRATITADGRRYYLGCFKSELDASAAYRSASLAIYGEFAAEVKPVSNQGGAP